MCQIIAKPMKDCVNVFARMICQYHTRAHLPKMMSFLYGILIHQSICNYFTQSLITYVEQLDQFYNYYQYIKIQISTHFSKYLLNQTNNAHPLSFSDFQPVENNYNLMKPVFPVPTQVSSVQSQEQNSASMQQEIPRANPVSSQSSMLMEAASAFKDQQQFVSLLAKQSMTTNAASKANNSNINSVTTSTAHQSMQIPLILPQGLNDNVVL